MSASGSFDNSRYEQACDQAIAMCDGNLRSTIKALIMANEYLEAELQELQAAISRAAPPRIVQQRRRLIDLEPTGVQNMEAKTGAETMADITYYVALPFLLDETARRSRARRKNARVRRPRCGARK